MSDDRTPGAELRPAPEDLLNELTPAEWRMVVSLVEAIATSDEAECPVCSRQVDRKHWAEHIGSCRVMATVVRTRRVEVLSRSGRVTAVLGDLTEAPTAPLFGLALLNREGTQRAVLALDTEGTKLEMANDEGNTAVTLGVNDEMGEMVERSTYLMVCDSQAHPLAGWQVTSDDELLTVWTSPGRQAVSPPTEGSQS